MVLGLDFYAFFRFDSLVQTFGQSAAFHHAACEFIDQDNAVILHDIISVAVEKPVRAQRLVDVVHQRDVLDVIHAAFLQQPVFAQ